MANNKKMQKHALPRAYKQAQHAFLSLTADTYYCDDKISDDFVRCLWMMATAASSSTNSQSRLSQPSPNSEPSLSQDTFTKLRGSLFSRFRIQIAVAIAKAAAAHFVPDSVLCVLCVVVYLARMMVSPHSSSGTGAGSLQPAPPRRAISLCIIPRARRLLFVSVCVCVALSAIL
jgi:hypothetical protein